MKVAIPFEIPDSKLESLAETYGFQLTEVCEAVTSSLQAWKWDDEFGCEEYDDLQTQLEVMAEQIADVMDIQREDSVSDSPQP